EDVRMLQPRGGAYLAQEPIGTECGTEIRMQHLDRDVAIVLEIVSEIHRRHAAGAKLALDPIPLGQRGGEQLRRHCHRLTFSAPGRRIIQTFASSWSAP